MTVVDIAEKAKLITNRKGKPVEVILPYNIYKHLIELEASMEIFKREKTLQKLQPKISYLKRRLASFQALEHVGEIRQKGFMIGIELVKDKKANIPYDWKEKIGVQVIMKAREKGVILRPLGNVIVIMPPLSITLPELKHLLGVTHWAIQESTR